VEKPDLRKGKLIKPLSEHRQGFRLPK